MIYCLEFIPFFINSKPYIMYAPVNFLSKYDCHLAVIMYTKTCINFPLILTQYTLNTCKSYAWLVKDSAWIGGESAWWWVSLVVIQPGGGLARWWIRRVVDPPGGESAGWWIRRVMSPPGDESAGVSAPVVSPPGDESAGNPFSYKMYKLLWTGSRWEKNNIQFHS